MICVLLALRRRTGVDYAMFTGGGLAWAEAQMKAGEHLVVQRWPRPGSAAGPDRSVLSLVQQPGAGMGSIVSLVVVQPTASESTER